MPKTISIHANRFIREIAIPMNNICPDFSYRILNIDTPTWNIRTPQINSTSIFPKKDTSSATYLNEFDRLIQEKYVNYTKLFTDGS